MAKISLEKSTIIDILVSQNRYTADQIEDVILSKPPLAGDNFASVVVAVKVVLTGGQVVPLFAKTLVQNEKYAEEMEGFDAFFTEGAYFNGLLPMFRDCFRSQVEMGELGFDYLPGFLYADDQLVLLEDLGARGYAMRNKFIKHKEPETRAVIESLAQFFAVSHAFIQKEGSVKNILTKYPSLEFSIYTSKQCEAFSRPMLEKGMRSLKAILEQRLCEGCDEALGTIDQWFADPYAAAVENSTDDFSDTKFLAICHGDIWTCNLMFNEAGDHAVLIDMQTIHIGNLVRDVGMYIFGTVDAKERRDWKKYLKIFYERFCYHLQVLGCQVRFSLEELEKEYVRLSIFSCQLGLYLTVMMPGTANLGTPDEMEGGFASMLQNALERWLKENPEQVRQVSQESMDILKEFEALRR